MNIWQLNPDHVYLLEGDATVRGLLIQLRVPNLFAGASEFDAMHAFVAFDNHPTHWIVVHFWQGVPEYSPNHAVHKFVGNANPNGLLLKAEPKNLTTRAQMEEAMISEALRMGAKEPFEFQQFPRE